MNGNSRWRLSAGLALVVAVGALWGCAQEVGDIDRTQPNKISKEIFLTDQEWYHQQTVVDTGMEGGNIGDGNWNRAAMAFMGFEASTKRVRWTVTETILYAHSSVELAEGLHQGFDEEDAYRFGVVAAFPIRGHFDVQRQYSTSTGEPSNVIVENTSDRPWYEREFMRVDWSTNLADGFNTFQGMYGRLSPANYDIPQDDRRAHPNRARISDDFIDTVTEYSYEPDPFACWGAFGMDTVWYCEGGRLSVRTSMVPVPEEQTYLPMNYLDEVEITRDGTPSGEPLLTSNIFDREMGLSIEVECNDQVRDWFLNDRGAFYEDRCRRARFDFFDRFGYFRTERIAWDHYVGGVDDNRRYYINRWNIWQTMLDEDGNRLAEEERIPKPIVFHLNVEYPKFMFDAAQATAQEWSDLFKYTARTAMGISESEIDDLLEEHYGHTEMFVIAENSCHPGPLVQWFNDYGSGWAEDRDSVDSIFRDYIASMTGDEVMEAALWDLSNEARTSLCAELEWATETRGDTEARFSWERLGDIRYSLFNWVEENVPWAGYGPSSADPVTGEILRGNANYNGGYIRRTATYGADLIQYFNGELSEDDILHGVQIRDDLFNNDLDSTRFGLTPEARREMSMRSGVDPDEVSLTGFAERPAVEDLDPMILDYGLDRIREEADRLAIANARQANEDTRMVEVLQSPRVKHMLMGDMELQMIVEAKARERHGPNFNDEQFNQAYLDIHTPALMQSRIDTRDRMFAERNILTADGLHRAAEMLVTYRGVANFFSGMERQDIMEYFMNKVFIGTQLHEIGHAVGLRHNFAGHSDALNYHPEYWKIERAVIEGRISREDAYNLQGDLAREITGRDDLQYASQSEFKVSTVMDYTADLTGRVAGLGRYDEAAIMFGYGEMVQQWSDDVFLANTFSFDTQLGNYRELPTVFAQNVSSQEEALLQGIDVILDGREYVPITQAMEQRRQGIMANTTNWSNYAFDSENPPAQDRTVNYELCVDQYNGLMLDCLTWAYGADQRELVNHAYDSYRALQPFWRYRRHNIARDLGNMDTFIGRVLRTVQVSQEPFRYYSIYRWFDLGIFTEDLQQAAMDGFNFFNELLSYPEPGRFCPFDPARSNVDTHWFYDLENTYVPARFHTDLGQCDNYIDVKRGEGYLYNFGFTSETNYRVDRVGTYYDKLIATIAMFNMSANFAQSSFFTDQRATNLSYWTLFQEELLNILSGILLGDYKRYGAVVNSGKIDMVEPVDFSTFGRGIENGLADRPRVYTPSSLNHQVNLLIGGLIYASTYMDRQVDFTHYVKIATTQDEWQDFGEGVDVVEFVHPITQQIYRAADIEGSTIGAELIDRANELAVRYVEVQELLDAADPGSSQYSNLRTTRDRRREQMQDVVSKMDMIRDMIDQTWSLR